MNIASKITILPEAVTLLPDTLRESYEQNGYLYFVGGVISDDPKAKTLFTTLSPSVLSAYSG